MTGGRKNKVQEDSAFRRFMNFYLSISEKVCTFAPDFESKKGRLAEGLGTGLQNLLLRFKSGSDLQKRNPPTGFLFSCIPQHLTPYTLHPTPYTLHLTPYTLHLTPYTLHLTPYTLHSPFYYFFVYLHFILSEIIDEDVA